MPWVYDFTAHNAYPFWDINTAIKWLYYLEVIKGHECEISER